MKQVILVCAFFLISALSLSAQNYAFNQSSLSIAVVEAPSLKWQTKDLNAGSVAIGEALTLTYRFVNEGSEPIKIARVKPSCGCTGVDYTKETIAPGEEAFVSAFYKAKHKGHFTKTVSVFTEGASTPIILKFHGEATEAAE